MTRIQHGPGPIIQGQDITNPERFIVQIPGDPQIHLMAQHEIAALPIRHQWFSGTATGLIASWWTRDVAEQHAAQLGVVYGQITPIEASKLTGVVAVLCDPEGRPLKGAT